MLHNEPIPLPIIQECFEHWCTVQNVLILWDGGSTKKEIERSKKTLIANLVVV